MTEVTITRKCQIHGDYQAVLLKSLGRQRVYTLCPKCEEERKIEEQKRNLLQERFETLNRRSLLKKEATIPERYENSSFNSFVIEEERQEEAKYIAIDYCNYFERNKSDGVNLIFYGYVGTGKTLLAAAIANDLLDKGFSVKFSSVLKITAELKGSYSDDSPTSHNEIIEKHSNCDLLVLDEIGVQNNTTWELNVLYELINRRYEKKFPTMVIANINPKDLSEKFHPDKIVDEYMVRHLGVRVLDRLRENDGISVFFDWESYRRKTYKSETLGKKVKNSQGR